MKATPKEPLESQKSRLTETDKLSDLVFRTRDFDLRPMTREALYALYFGEG